MNKRNKMLFLALTLATVLILISAVNATNTTDQSIDNTISEKTSTPATSVIKEETPIKEKIETKTNKEIKKTNKTKEDVKTATKTVEVNDGTSFVDAFTTAQSDNENEEYVINLNDGNYDISSSLLMWGPTGTVKSLIINGNNNILNPLVIMNGGDLTIKETTIIPTLGYVANMNTIKFIKTTINYGIKNNEGCTLIITDDCTLGENFFIDGDGTVISNITGGQNYDGNMEVNNENINKDITIPETGNITFNNCNITAKITNNGNITLVNCSLSNNTLSVTGSKTDGFLIQNNGNLTMIGCVVENNTFNTTYSGLITNEFILTGTIHNNGFMNVVNCSLNNNTVGFLNSTTEGNHAGQGACISNNGTLNIYNSCFNNNWAGSMGGAIYNGYYYLNYSNYQTIFFDSVLNIVNSEFNNNAAGMSGGAIKSGPTIYNINNTNFTNNSVDNQIDGSSVPGGIAPGPGALIIGGNGSIDNCVFENNNVGTKDGQVFYNNFMGGALSLGNGINYVNNSKFINNTAERAAAIAISGSNYDGMTGRLLGYSTTVENCVFEDNYLEFTTSDINSIILNTGEYTILNLINNEFKNNYHATNLIRSYCNNNNFMHEYPQGIISDNKFTNNTMTTNTISLDDKTTWTITNNQYSNTTIDDNIELNLPDYIFAGEPITITGTYSPKNPEDYDQNITEQTQYNIYINGKLNQTQDTIEFTITPTTGNMIITIQPTISQSRKSFSIRPLNNVTITPENYDEYIYEGRLLGVNRDSKITFQGTFTDKEDILIDTPDIIIDGKNANFTNTMFTLEATGITLTNMKITNTQTTYPIKNTADNNKITNNKITLTNTQGKTAAIYNKASNTEITNNILYVDGPAGTIDYNQGLGIADTQAILLIGGNKNIIEYNNIQVTCTSQSSIYGTIEAITNHQEATNTQIQYNNITVTGIGNFNYAINTLSNVQNITITENNIQVTGKRYTAGIQTGDGAENIQIYNNNIKCICQNTTPVDEEAITYGIITLNIEGYNTPNHIYIERNNIDLKGSINYGIELYKTNTTQVEYNNITVKGLQSMGIGCAYSQNTIIDSNNIKTYGDSSKTLGQVTEEIQPANVGIQIQQDSDNARINYNTIETYDTQAQDICINIRSSNAIVMDNKLTSSTGYGEDTINAPTDTVIENNIITTTIGTENVTALKNTPTTLTATVTDEFENNVNGGSVIFTDPEGNTIATAEVIDGTATTTATFTATGESKITATYTPTSTGLTSSTAEASLVIKDKFATTITIDEITATVGQTITLTAHLTDENGQAINGGKVTFKVNGKTVKDANGKVVYAKVVDGVATAEYTVPDNLADSGITITATYAGTTKYNKANTTTTTTVTPKELTLTTTDIQAAAGTTVTLTATLSDTTINTGKIVFKVNGKTVKDTNGKVIYAKVANGTVSVEYTIPENMKAKDYNITAVYIPSSGDRLEDTKTLTVTA